MGEFFSQSNLKIKEVMQIVQSNGSNGQNDEPSIEVSFEPIDDETGMVQDRWLETNAQGERRITYSDEVRNQLGIEEEDEDTQSD